MAVEWLKSEDGKDQRWEGGRVRRGRDGEPVFVIERKVGEARYTKSLPGLNIKQARVQLAAFLAAPESFQTTAEARAAKVAERTQAEANAVRLDEHTIGSFMAYLRGAKLDEHGQALLQRDKAGIALDPEGLPLEVEDKDNAPRTPHYRRVVKTFLKDWLKFYAGRDLRFVELQEVKQQLAKWGNNKKGRITALKSFMSFLRKERFLLKASEDPTLDLKTPAARPEKGKRVKLGSRKFYEMSRVAKLYAEVNTWATGEDAKTRPQDPGSVQSVRDIIRLAACHGMHLSEIDRLARGHDARVSSVSGMGEIAGTLTFVHKSGRVHVVSVDAKGLAAAQRLQLRGSAPVDSYRRKVVARAAKDAGVNPINLGTLRHSFATWARAHGRLVKASDAGVPLAAVAAVLGHQTTSTTTHFYVGTEVPDMVALPLKLNHPQDPVPLTPKLGRSPTSPVR